MEDNQIKIEQEIQSRVEFKMNEFLTAVKNRVRFKHKQAFDMTQKSQHAWEAFEEISEMIKKEINMPTPYDDMTKFRMNEARNKAIDNIVDRLKINGTMDGRQVISFLVREIENAQNY